MSGIPRLSNCESRRGRKCSW